MTTRTTTTCLAKHDGDEMPYICTRERGHDGAHVADDGAGGVEWPAGLDVLARAETPIGTLLAAIYYDESDGHEYARQVSLGDANMTPGEARQAAVDLLRLAHALDGETGNIAQVVGVSKDTVHEDQQATSGVRDRTPAPQTPAPERLGEGAPERDQTPQGEEAQR